MSDLAIQPGFSAGQYLICLRGIMWREALRFVHQRERFVSALVRPLVWLFIFAAGFRQILGVSIIPPYETYVLYEVYVTPGLIAMIQLFNGMQSSLSMVYDREMGNMRMLLVSPFPRWFLLVSKLLASTTVSILQVAAFLVVAEIWGVDLPYWSFLTVLPALILVGLMLGALGMLLSSLIKQLENFAGVMNFVIFPMFFASSALYPLWLVQQSSPVVYLICRLNPFTYGIELIRFSLYAKLNLTALVVVVVVTVVFMTAAILAYDPARGLLVRRGGGASRMIARRSLLATGAALVVSPAWAEPQLRLGILQFGTVQWVADVIRRHDLAAKHGFALTATMLANTEAGRVSLMAGASDVVLSDWPFVAAQRAAGVKLCCAPFSSASGGIMVGKDSPIRTLADLRGRKIGVAGGPEDKSWLVVRAAAHATQGIDLAAEAHCVYGAPPLLSAKLQQIELDAVLTFWNFAAKLEANGFHQVVSVADCVRALNIPPDISMVGFVFHQDWADANRPAIDGFLAAVDDAQRLLASSDAEWVTVRPLMRADDDAVFQRLRDRFRAGMAHADPAQQAQGASRLLAILHATGGALATEGIEALPPGVFWPGSNGAG